MYWWCGNLHLTATKLRNENYLVQLIDYIDENKSWSCQFQNPYLIETTNNVINFLFILL
jgi:hypothetical protein